MITLYGIKNCDTVKKACKWLDNHNIDYQYHDFRQDGLDQTLLNQWVKELGWEILLNRRGTTWRKLDESLRENINQASAITIMLDQPAIIKRPVLDLGKKRHVGFKEFEYQDLLG